jgi:hypothetical protein
MKTRQVFDFDTTPVSLRSACDMRRACSPICASPDDLERLLAVVGLRYEQVLDVHAQLLRICGIERMFGIDERRHAPQLLRFGNDLQRQRRLAGGLGPEDFDDAAARNSADAERVVDADRPGRNGVYRLDGAFLPESHDRALAELLFDLPDGELDGFGTLAVLTVISLNWSLNWSFSWSFSWSFGWHGLLYARSRC